MASQGLKPCICSPRPARCPPPSIIKTLPHNQAPAFDLFGPFPDETIMSSIDKVLLLFGADNMRSLSDYPGDCEAQRDGCISSISVASSQTPRASCASPCTLRKNCCQRCGAPAAKKTCAKCGGCRMKPCTKCCGSSSPASSSQGSSPPASSSQRQAYSSSPESSAPSAELPDIANMSYSELRKVNLKNVDLTNYGNVKKVCAACAAYGMGGKTGTTTPTSGSGKSGVSFEDEQTKCTDGPATGQTLSKISRVIRRSFSLCSLACRQVKEKMNFSCSSPNGTQCTRPRWMWARMQCFSDGCEVYEVFKNSNPSMHPSTIPKCSSDAKLIFVVLPNGCIVPFESCCCHN